MLQLLEWRLVKYIKWDFAESRVGGGAQVGEDVERLGLGTTAHTDSWERAEPLRHSVWFTSLRGDKSEEPARTFPFPRLNKLFCDFWLPPVIQFFPG